MKATTNRLLLLALCANTAAAMAQTHISNPIDSIHSASHQLDEVVVSGVAGSILHRNSPAPISVISHDELRQRMSTNIIDAVAKEPGVSQVTTGGGISKPVIRGLGYNRVVTVNNSLRQEEQQWGDEHGATIDGNAVGSVEVLKGPASLMYGSDAMAGVLIFRPQPIPMNGTLVGDATTEYQTNSGLFSLSAGLGGRNGSFFWNVRGTGLAAHDMRVPHSGYVFGTGFAQQAGNALLGLTGAWGTSRLTVSHVRFKPEIAEGEDEQGSDNYGAALPFQRIEHTMVSSDNSLNLGRGVLQAVLGYQLNSRREFEESADIPGLNLRLQTLSYNLNYSLPLAQVGPRLRTGVSGMFQHSENKGTEFLVPDYRINDFGAFAAVQHELSRVSLSAGLRYDHRHVSGDRLEEDGEELFTDFSRSFNAMTGSVGTVLHLSELSRIKLNLSGGFRSPNISELSANGVHEGTQHYERGNTGLKAERSTQADLGYEYSGNVVRFNVSAFFNDIDNYIFLARQGGAEVDGLPVYGYTQGHARLWGAELLFDIHPLRHLHFENTFSFVRSYLLHQSEDARHLPFTPAPHLRSELRYDIVHRGNSPVKTFENLWASVNVECDARQNDVYAVNETETPTAGHAILGAELGTDIRSGHRRLCSLYLTGSNLLNKRYFSHLSRLKYAGNGIPAPGRNIGIKAVFYIGG